MKIQTIVRISVFTLVFCLGGLNATNKPEHIRPFGLRRTFEHGFGDRYYTGMPAYDYENTWPEWKRDIWYTGGSWNDEEAPAWIAYYDYPYVVWPNFYRYFGSPYYTRAQREKSRLAKIVPKKNYKFTEDSASF